MTDEEALDVFVRMLKGEDVVIESSSIEQSNARFEEVARWAERAHSLKVSKGYHLIGRPDIPGYVRETGSLKVKP